jgi:hypothetical protein
MSRIAGVLVFCIVAGHSDAFSPQVGFTSRLAHRMRPTSSSVQQRPGVALPVLRMQEGGGGGGGGEGEREETVEITREELKALAEQAGIRVQIGESEGPSSSP